jgi:phosphoheptose isomerase
MPLSKLQGNVKVSADTNDILSGHVALKGAGPGVYDVWAISTAGNDATITINDGKADVVSAEPIITGLAGSTGPSLDIRTDVPWTIHSTSSDRLRIDVIDGTNCEVLVKVVKR